MRKVTVSQSLDADERRLGELLLRAGISLGVDAVRDLIAGVAAAPPGIEPDAWMALIEPRPRGELRAMLAALVAERRRAAAPRPADHEPRLAALRALLRRRRLAGVVVPRADEHQSEYVPASAERLAWLSGFTGSAGTAVVLRERAALFVDGRYTLQAARETDPRLWEIVHSTEQPIGKWIARHLPSRGRLGYDAWLHSPSEVGRLRAACRQARGHLVAVDGNAVDAIWPDQPPPPIAPIVAHDLRFAGRTSADKRQQAAAALRSEGEDAVVLSAPDSIAWLLNIRGGDVPYAPLPLAFAILHSDTSVDLFIDPRKLVPRLREHLGPAVTPMPSEAFGAALDRLGGERRVVRIEAQRTPEWVVRRLRRAGARTVAREDPCALPKATKNEVELAGMRAAHVRDGAALCRFLAWLRSAATSGTVSEMAAAERLEAFRRDGEHFRGPSFPTISAAGPNAAIVHYRVSADSNRTLAPGTLYLVDSGGQYLDGTTDVTRTVAIGAPSGEMRERFTRVLKGHIALATAVFPKGTNGPQLDTLARRALWAAGLDYDHGTGHGVGHYLGVHEGPQRISKLANDVALAPGMVLSDEPGYYKGGAYGIRIENLVCVVQVAAPEGAEKELFGFSVLTLAPIERGLIAGELLTAEERAWLDDYHTTVRSALVPIVDAETAVWLNEATAPLGCR